MPYFSVIIPVYNREKRIAKAVNSVLQQTFCDFEVIIIDDASTDRTRAVVEEYKDPRISYFQNVQNLERCTSRNRGIEKAVGKFICF